MKKILLTSLLIFTVGLATSLVAEQDTDVKVYGHTGCPWTVKAMKYLDKQNISYTMLDVKNDVTANRDFYDRGYKKIPQLVIAGTDEVSGWRKGALKKLLIKHELLAE